MNVFDRAILEFLNSFAQRSLTLDSIATLLGHNMLLKGGVFAALLWWAWFRRSPRQARDREIVLFGACSALFSVVVARIVAHAFPFRERPLRNPDLHFLLPHGIDPTSLYGWSSFPSDHAAFFFALAVTLYFISRRVGILAFIYAGVVICMPRIYLGIHYPTDVIAGGAIGAGVASLALITSLRAMVTRPVLNYQDTNPGLFYACLSFLFYLIGTVCEPAPEIVNFALSATENLLADLGLPLSARSGPQSILEPLAVALFICVLLLALHKLLTIKRGHHPRSG